MNKKLDLRVFKRNTSFLVLLWSKIPNLEQKDIEVFCKSLKEAEYKPIDFYIGMPTEFNELKEHEKPNEAVTVICVVVHDKNNLEPYADYMFKVKYGDIEQTQKVYAVGIKPEHEREMPHKNSHIHGWDYDMRKWAKINLIRLENGTYALPVVIINANIKEK